MVGARFRGSRGLDRPATFCQLFGLSSDGPRRSTKIYQAQSWFQESFVPERFRATVGKPGLAPCTKVNSDCSYAIPKPLMAWVIVLRQVVVSSTSPKPMESTIGDFYQSTFLEQGAN